MAIIHGMNVTLYERTESGVDEFNRTIIEEHPVVVPNVIVAPVSSTEALETLDLTGKKAVYQLGIPKGDSHSWEDCRVSFFGQMFRCIGFLTEGIEDQIPLEWNRKIMVERYG